MLLKAITSQMFCRILKIKNNYNLFLSLAPIQEILFLPVDEIQHCKESDYQYCKSNLALGIKVTNSSTKSRGNTAHE